MTTEEKMTLDEVYKYLRLMKPRYLQADRVGKSALLDEMETVTGRHRKSLIRRLRGSVQRRPRAHERERTYKADVDLALRRIWESYDYICAERLQPNLVSLAQQLAAHGELELPSALQTQLGEVGLTTVRERLRQFRQDEPQLARRAPGPRNRTLADIPMQRIAWDEPVPGHFEVDLVFHSGPDASGEYGHTLQMIDVYSGWSERVAILGRSYRVMEDGFRRILRRVPFPVSHIHPDNGSEFFNEHMRTFWAQYPHVHLSRSRPYQKNDNRFVEQKNSSLVRRYLGDIRLDTVAQIQALNAIYGKLWLYNNTFQPSLRLIEKTYVPATEEKPAHLKRKYSALTPWQRLCSAKVVAPDIQQLLQLRIDITNPRQLRQHIYFALEQLFALPGATPEHIENVFETLAIDQQS
jgi:hypothetical protein